LLLKISIFQERYETLRKDKQKKENELAVATKEMQELEIALELALVHGSTGFLEGEEEESDSPSLFSRETKHTIEAIAKYTFIQAFSHEISRQSLPIPGAVMDHSSTSEKVATAPRTIQ
jgi:hypothetical protein